MALMDAYDTDFLTRLTVRRLAEINKTRAKVETLQRRAGLLAEFDLERKKLDILNRLTEHYQSQTHNMGYHIAELKQYLQSVYDADLLGDATLQALTMEHCIAYTARLMNMLSDASKHTNKANWGVLELVTSTLAMFSQRPAALPSILDAGVVPVVVRLLSPLFPVVAVVNVANAAGNMASDASLRLAFRAAGGVGALVRLLRSDVEASAQAAAGAALSLMAARDTITQDSVRYLGGIDHLVELLASKDAYVCEVARYCLMSLRQGNLKNQADIVSSIRASSALAKDLWKLEAASQLLKFEDALPAARSYDSLSNSSIRNLLDQMEFLSRPSTADSNLHHNTLKSVASSSASKASYLTRSYDNEEKHKDFASLISTSSSLGSGAAADTSSRLGSLIEVESELLKKKHLSRFSAEEVVLLLEEMGLDKLDLRGFKLNRVSGAQLLEMSEDELSIDLMLPRPKVRKLRALQRAAHLFDRIATLPRQGKVSEAELRLYLAGQGTSSGDISKIIKLFKTLVRTDKFDFVAFWDFITSYDWIAQAFKIYNMTA